MPVRYVKSYRLVGRPPKGSPGGKVRNWGGWTTSRRWIIPSQRVYAAKDQFNTLNFKPIGRRWAATKIQAMWRGYKARKAYKQHLAINRHFGTGIRERRSKARAKSIRAKAGVLGTIKKLADVEFQKALAGVMVTKPAMPGAPIAGETPVVDNVGFKAGKLMERANRALGRSPEDCRRSRHAIYAARSKEIAEGMSLRRRLAEREALGEHVDFESEVQAHQIGQEAAATGLAEAEYLQGHAAGDAY